MTKQQEKGKSFSLLNIPLVLLILVFCFSLFKNISYPLIWNDESFGVAIGERIVEYGYPKVHDGKNVVFMSLAADIKDKEGNLVGYNKEHDAYIYTTWGNDYWAAIGVCLAKFTDDIYAKTALLRLPFALIGLLGLAFFLFPIRSLFPRPEHFKLFLVLFVFIELFSVSLVLHIREARYYSLVIFLCACYFYLYFNYFLSKRMSDIRYYIFMTLLLFFTYHINFIAFAIFCVVLAANRGVIFLLAVKKTSKNLKPEFISLLKASVPAILSLVFIFPFLIFFETFKTSAIISEYQKFSYEMYKANIENILKHMADLEFLYLLIVVKIVWFFFVRQKPGRGDKALAKKWEDIDLMNKFSIFATSFFVLYIFITARTPFMFVRYYIVLQPIMILIILLDTFIIFYSIELLQKKIFAQARIVFGILLLITFSANAKSKIPYLKDHVYEISHQYKGPLDYVIPYILENYKNTDTLTIATNYEEFSYMYYLKSKVIVGYIFNNIEEDAKCTPDIIIYRKTWGTNPKVFNDFMQKAKYRKVSFPVLDYPVNNIPELDFVIKHQFRTNMARNEQEKLDIFVRDK